tara:strand:+ start:31 stop:315 length:285 start_codon:yes stop_codon:yes gene_type:complete
MKKLLGILVMGISLILTNVAYAKLSKDYWNEIFNGCYYSGIQVKKLKAYCTCYTNKFSANFSDETVLQFIETAGDLTKNPTVIKYTKQCINKHK